MQDHVYFTTAESLFVKKDLRLRLISRSLQVVGYNRH